MSELWGPAVEAELEYHRTWLVETRRGPVARRVRATWRSLRGWWGHLGSRL